MLVALSFPFSSVIAQTAQNLVTATIEFNVPYSLIQSWVNNGRLALPTYTSSMTKQQITALQYFLKSHAHPIEATGYFDLSTKQALARFQGGDYKTLSEETKNGINRLLAYLYCPVGQNSELKQDFRLRNVNKTRVLPVAYVPNNLVLEDEDEFLSAGPVCLEAETFEAMRKMYNDAKDDGVSLFVTSSYRGEDNQDYLLNVMVSRYGDYAYKIVALPGQSEHNLGTSLDFAGYEDGKRVPLTASRQFEWLNKNAAGYGFVNSYPAGKEQITGFRAEPWHWRYVGVPVATKVESEKITLTEFLDKYKIAFQGTADTYGKIIQKWLNEVVIGG